MMGRTTTITTTILEPQESKMEMDADYERKEQLALYLKMVEELSFTILDEDPALSAIQALRQAANIVEGQMQGY